MVQLLLMPRVNINFTDLDNGNYTVEFETPAGYTPTVKNTTAEDKDSNGLTTTGVIKMQII